LLVNGYIVTLFDVLLFTRRHGKIWSANSVHLYFLLVFSMQQAFMSFMH